jgi:signal transduction histidine kinase
MSYRADLQTLMGTAKIVRATAKHLLDESGDSLTDEQRSFTARIEESAVEILEYVPTRLEPLGLTQATNQSRAETVHQLKISLTTIIGYHNLLEASEGLHIGSINERQCYQLMKIRRAARLAQACINRWQSTTVPLPVGPMRLARRFYDLKDMLKKAMEELAKAVKGKAIELQLKVEENSPNAFGDDNRTYRIISNLLSNAARFTNSGTISITVQTVHVQEGQLRLQIAIADTGIGMLPEMCLAANNARRMPAPDRGFGLLLAIGLARAQGGNLWLESQEGVGTVAYIQLPTIDEQPRRDSSFNTPRRLYRSHRKGFVLDSP